MASALPENRVRFTLAELAAITGGSLSGPGDLAIEGVATDSRGAMAGKLFVALPGDRYDGHAFVSAALRGGARAILAEREVAEPGVPSVRVASTLTALGALARHQRRRWGGRLVAVAGSAGKTTTRSLVAAALDALFPGAVHFAPGNLNNRIGVPLVLLGLAAHRYGVVEIGTNLPGEVAELTALAEPDVGVLTLIGVEHSEGLGTLDQIEAEEGSLFEGLAADAAAVGNGDDERVVRRLGLARVAQKLRYGFGSGADYRVVERMPGAFGPSPLVLARPERPLLSVDCPLLGRAGAAALAAGVAAAEVCSGGVVGSAELAAAFARVGVGEPGRLSPIALGDGTLLIDDSYNSNPASLACSVAAAAEVAKARAARLVLVLGEMRELGPRSPELHRAAGEQLLDFGASLVLAVAGDARWLLEPFARAGVQTDFALDAAAAATGIGTLLCAGDVVLVKASRSVRAERIVEALVAERGRSS